MSEPRISVTVRIAGEEHVIRANAEPEHTLRCAHIVDERITEIRSRSGLIEGHRAAILAALSLSDELFRTQEELDRLRRDLRLRGEALIRTVDEVLGAPDAPEPAQDAF